MFLVFRVRQMVRHCRQMVRQNIDLKCAIGLQRSAIVRAQGCASGLECLPHIADIGATYPGVVGCAIQLTGA